MSERDQPSNDKVDVPTPRTDKLRKSIVSERVHPAWVQHAEQLERELADAEDEKNIRGITIDRLKEEIGRLSARSAVVASSEPARDPDFGTLREDLEAIAERVYERLHAEIGKRGINLPGCDTTDKVLEVLDRWAVEALQTPHSATERMIRVPPEGCKALSFKISVNCSSWGCDCGATNISPACRRAA